VPLALVAAITLGAISGTTTAWAAATAGLAAALTGAHMKHTLITGAGFNQGFALAHLPVRGQAREVTPGPIHTRSANADSR
jgi:hypothetical protein